MCKGGSTEGGGQGGGSGGLDGALAVGAAVEIGVHETGFEVGEEFFIDVRLAAAGGDLVGDDAETGAEFVDETEERAAMDELRAGVEEAGGKGRFIGFLGEDGAVVRISVEEVGDLGEAAGEAVGEDGAGEAGVGNAVLIAQGPPCIGFLDVVDGGVLYELEAGDFLRCL